MRASGPGESALLLLDVVDVLDARKIPYAVIGATAATVYGAMRASMDADLVVSIALTQAVDLEGALRNLGLDTQLNRGDFDDPIPAMLRVGDTHQNRVDLLIGLRGLEQQAFARAVSVPFQGAALKFIGKEDFIAMKLFAGGPIDIQDATRALEGNRTSLNVDLMRKIAANYGAATLAALERLLSVES